MQINFQTGANNVSFAKSTIYGPLVSGNAAVFISLRVANISGVDSYYNLNLENNVTGEIKSVVANAPIRSGQSFEHGKLVLASPWKLTANSSGTNAAAITYGIAVIQED